MFFHRIFTQGLSIHSYLLGDEKTKQCVAIDPVRHVVPYIIQAQNAGFEITSILETHVHADFVSGAKELKHQLNEKPVIYASGMGGMEWIPAYADEVVDNGFELKIGELRLRALHTPGHTPEHMMWICFDDSRSQEIPWFSFTGDCLFVGSVGRPDLLGKKAMEDLLKQFYHTLFTVLGPLPDFLEIFPSHGEGSICGKALKTRGSSTLGYERLFNVYLKEESQENWIQKIKNELLPEPPYCQWVKKMNLKGPSLLSSLKPAKLVETSDAVQGLFLLDIRLPESFANSHIKGSINIPISATFLLWAGWMLPQKDPLGIVTENLHHSSEIIEQLRLMGFDQEVRIILYHDEKVIANLPAASFPMLDVDEVDKFSEDALYLIDVRTAEEWRSGHASKAHHIELISLESAYTNIPKGVPVALICRSGHRASLAASLLEKLGASVINVRGGMQAWKQSGLMVEDF